MRIAKIYPDKLEIEIDGLVRLRFEHPTETTIESFVTSLVPPADSVVDMRLVKPVLSSLEFLDLFTESEQLAVATASMQSPQVKLWYDRTLAAMFITLTDPRTEAGLNAMIEMGLLTAERKAQIIGQMS